MLSTYDTRNNKSSKSHTQDSIPSFIRKTYDILDEAKNPDIIDWNPEGTALVIKKPSEFCQKVLPQYFKHNNLTSFVRQLNMYNFHKRRTQNIDHVYYHELFQRGQKHLLKEIRRKNHENNNPNNGHMDKYPRTMETLDHSQSNKDTNGILCENQFLKRLYNDAMSKIAIFENQIQELTNQNNSLRSQLYQPGEPVPQQWGYKSVPASLEVKSADLPKEESMNMQDVSIPPLQLRNQITMGVPVSSMTSYFTAEESTEPTEASHNSPNNQAMESEMKTEYVSEQMAPLSLNIAPQESQANGVKINGLRISRGDTSIGKLFESWNTQNVEVNNVLGKRDLNVEKGVSQFLFPEPALKKAEMGLYAKKSLISNGIEDKELMRIFAQRGTSNENFELDLMNFGN